MLAVKIKKRFIALAAAALLLPTMAAADRTKLPRVAIDYQYLDARDFHEGLAAVRNDKAWGYIDNLGRTVLPFVYQVPEVGDFSGGMAFIGDRYIRTDGNPAFEDRTFESGLPFSHGLAAVQSGGKWGFIDATGKFVIAPLYEAAGSFSSGLAPVRRDGLWGYVDAEGHIKIPPRYIYAEEFSEGLAAVEVRGRIGFIDTKGHTAIEPRFDEAGRFVYGLAPARLQTNYRGWGFINTQGRIIISHRFNAAGPFSDRLAPVATDGRWGFINTRGERVLSNQYDEARPFNEGLAAVCQDGKWGYIRQ